MRRAANGVPTFGEIADQYIQTIELGFRNAKHRYQWRQTLGVYAKPLRPKPVDAVSTEDVLGCLQPLWQTKPETAARLRGRIERVLDAAKARGCRTGENPARWRGHLDKLLPKLRKLTRGHLPAMPFRDVPEFFVRLRKRDGVAARAVEFAILTAARPGEARGARWSEIDLQARLWTVPAERMKPGREHRVPLTHRAMEILEAMAAVHEDDFVFPGTRKGKPLSDMTLRAVLRRMGCPFSVHGFRSSFRDWAGDCSPFPREISEPALSHRVGDQTELAYRRGDALEKRRQLMDAWALFCEGSGGNVVPLRHAKGTA